MQIVYHYHHYGYHTNNQCSHILYLLYHKHNQLILWKKICVYKKEYIFQVPANRIGFEYFSLGQLKITQEVITLGVFIPFAIFYMGEPFKVDYIWAGLCLVGAVYFMFRN